jgi:hypothetical protein
MGLGRMTCEKWVRRVAPLCGRRDHRTSGAHHAHIVGEYNWTVRRRCQLLLFVVAACGDGQPVEGDASVTPPTPPLIEAPASITLVEGESTTFSVSVAPVSESVLVDIAPLALSVVTVTPHALTFDAEHITAEMTVATENDDDNVINETTDILLAIEGGDSHHIMTRVIDNDVQQIVADATNLTLTESTTATFNVRLARRPSAPVTLTVWSDAPQIAAVNPATLTFAPASYNVPLPVTVTGAVDTNTANGTAHVYVGQVSNVTDARVDVSVTDDDVQALVLSATNVPLTEGTSGTFSVSLAFDPLQATSVQLQSSDITAAAVTSPTLQFNSSNYNIPQPVTIVATDDVDQLNESVTLSLSGAGSGSVTVPVLDNDLIRVQTSTVWEGLDNQFYVSLADKPGIAGLTLSIQVLSGDVTVSPSSLFIANGDYTSGHSIHVLPIVDYNSNADRQAAIRVSAPGQTPRDITFTIEDRIPGSLNYVSLRHENSGAGAIGFMDITLAPTNTWPADGRVVISLPAGFDASAATFVSSSADGSYSFAATTSSMTVSRTNGWPSSASFTLRLGNVRNPPVSGTYQIGVSTKTGSGDPLDSGTGSDYITVGPLSGATVTLGDTQPGATTTATIAFTGRNPWPADGKLEIYFPTVLDVSAATVSAQSGVDGTFTTAVSGAVVTLTRSGGTPTAGGTPISITLANVVNPPTAQATYSFRLVTETSTGTSIDIGFPKGVVIGCPATITKAPQRGTNLPFGGNPWQYADGVTSPSWGTDVAYIYSCVASDYLVASDFQFTIPSGATVTGIRFDVEREYVNYNAVDSSVRIIKSTLGSTDRASTALWTKQPVSFGGPTDLWGETWTAADIESSTFGIAMAVNAVTPTTPAYVRVGYVSATVYLSCP